MTLQIKVTFAYHQAFLPVDYSRKKLHLEVDYSRKKLHLSRKKLHLAFFCRCNILVLFTKNSLSEVVKRL